MRENWTEFKTFCNKKKVKVKIVLRWPTCFWRGLGTGRSVQSFKTEGAPNSDTLIALINLDVAIVASAKQMDWQSRLNFGWILHCWKRANNELVHLNRNYHIFHIAHISLHSVAKIKKTARHKLRHIITLFTFHAGCSMQLTRLPYEMKLGTSRPPYPTVHSALKTQTHAVQQIYNKLD